MPGGDDNSAHDINIMLDGARRIRDTLGCAVLLIDHPGHEGTRMRGSGAKFQAAEVVIKARKTGHHALQLVQEKSRNAAHAAPLNLRLESEAESLVAVHNPDFNAAPPPMSEAERSIMRALVNGPLRSGELEADSGLSGGTFERALSSLKKQGIVVREGMAYPTEMTGPVTRR
jgi:hypothetical protein